MKEHRARCSFYCVRALQAFLQTPPERKEPKKKRAKKKR